MSFMSLSRDGLMMSQIILTTFRLQHLNTGFHASNGHSTLPNRVTLAGRVAFSVSTLALRLRP